MGSNDNDLGLPARFWTKVHKTANDGGCWEWTAAKQGRYGSFWRDSKNLLAHRVALEAKLGRPLLPGMQACHTCDNPPCVNPDHLWEGTSEDNNRDSMRKGRRARGKTNGSAKLSEADVAAIRSAPGTQQEIAERFGTTQTNVSLIQARKTWQHAP